MFGKVSSVDVWPSHTLTYLLPQVLNCPQLVRLLAI